MSVRNFFNENYILTFESALLIWFVAFCVISIYWGVKRLVIDPDAKSEWKNYNFGYLKLVFVLILLDFGMMYWISIVKDAIK